jgi:hypothetical protein
VRSCASLRRAVVVSVVLGVGSAVSVGVAGADQAADGARRYSSPSYLKQVEGAKKRERQRRGSKGGRDARRRSRGEHRGLGRGAAWRLAVDSFGGPLVGPIGGGPRLRAGERVRRFVGDYWAEIGKDGRRGSGLIRSFVPMRAKDESGKKRPVDLGLVERAGYFEPANSIAPVRFAKRAGQGLHFEASGLKLTPGGTSSQASVKGDRVFYPEVGGDVDFVAMPLPTGAESFWQIRSSDAAEEFVLEADLPDGARLRYSPETSRSLGTPPSLRRPIEVVRAGKVMARISPPTAHDADGKRVGAAMAFAGSTIRVRVEHRGADLKYPLLLDPVVEDYMRWTAKGGGTGDQAYDPNLTFEGWSYAYGGSYGTLYQCAGCPTGYWGRGLYLFAAKGNYFSSNRWHEWIYSAPGDAYIYRADFGWVYANPAALYNAAGGYLGNTQTVEGIWSQSNFNWERAQVNAPGGPASFHQPWASAGTLRESYLTHCVGPNPCGWGSPNQPAGTPGNKMIFAQVFPYNGYAFYSQPDASIHGAQIAMHEFVPPKRHVPKADEPPNPSHTGLDENKWVSSASIQSTVRVTDSGLGLTSLNLTSPTGWSKTGRNDVCSGTQASGKPQTKPETPCPTSMSVNFDYSTDDMPEGIVPIRATAKDIVGNQADIASWTVKVDHSDPGVDLPFVGETIDTEPDEPDPTVYVAVDQTQFGLEVDATDPLSGVREISLLDSNLQQIDVETLSCTPQCPTAPGTVTLNGSVAQLAENQVYSVKVTDAAGNVTIVPVRLIADRDPPSPPSNVNVRDFELPTTARISWDAEEDPDLASGIPGSGVASTEYRYRRLLMDYSPWVATEDTEFELTGAILAEAVEVQLRQVDEAGNRGPVLTQTLLLIPPAEQAPGSQPSGGTNTINIAETFNLDNVLIPRAGEQVTLKAASGQLFEQLTDRDGRAQFRDVPDGTYEIFYGEAGEDAERKETVTVSGQVVANAGSSRDYGDANQAERNFCFGGGPNFFLCGYFRQDAQDAAYFAERLFHYGKPPSNGTRANAFLHAFWTAKMVRSIAYAGQHDELDVGPADYPLALDFATAHESEERNGDLRDKRFSNMDMHNNRVGYDHGVRHAHRASDYYLCKSLRARNAKAQFKRYRRGQDEFARAPNRKRLLFVRRYRVYDPRADQKVSLRSRSYFPDGQEPCINPRTGQRG